MTMRDLIGSNRPFVPGFLRRNGGSDGSLLSLQEEMNNLFDSFFGDTRAPLASHVLFPAIDIVENDKEFDVRAEVPGMELDDIDISVSEGLLTLKGAKKEEKEEKDKNYLRRESSYGSFQRTVVLPGAADSDKAEASFKNGIVSITIPKKQGAIQKSRKLQIRKMS